MITRYYSKSSFKKKFTVVIIWLIALVMTGTLVNFILNTKIDFILLIPIIMANIFIILGILLRCKIARWFTLLGIYTFVFSPLVKYIMMGEIISLSSIVLYLSVILISIYVFSNKKAMELFYIESNPSEHLPLILLALTINTVYTYTFKIV